MSPREGGAAGRIVRGALDAICIASIAALVVLPLADLVAARLFWKGLAGAGSIANHAVLVLAFVSAGIASLERRHLSLAGPDPAKGGSALVLVALADALASIAQADANEAAAETGQAAETAGTALKEEAAQVGSAIAAGAKEAAQEVDEATDKLAEKADEQRAETATDGRGN